MQKRLNGKSQIKQIANAHQATLVEYSIIYSYSDQEAIGPKQPQGSELYIWVVKPTGEIAFREVNLKASKISLENLVPSSRASIGVRGSSDIKRGGIRVERIIQDNGSSQQKSLKQLYELLIKPVEEFLPTDPNARVIFIPQGPLFSVPFAALMNTNGKYLIEEHTISTTPSIQILSLIHKQRQRIRGIGQNDLVVGNPQMPSISVRPGEPPVRLSNLPGAEKEAVEIAKLLKTKPFIGSQATKKFIVQQMPQAKRIHLATHGLVDDSSGQLGIPGIIVLAPSGKDDGLLTANEILGMKLNAELVILSACDTARGKITSDGVDGLSRSFMIAGVPSLIVSQWSVSDSPTAELMIEFYRNLQNGKLDKAQSLRQAMLTVMRQNPNPRDWAGFILIGEAD
ncbi:CHAT domain-containing protein [Nostoc sp.]|uniref:CHAT domain-containing protein n=1 Tax=Nostoc sp. TaxID=1180 RepID=UPI002FF710FF